MTPALALPPAYASHTESGAFPLEHSYVVNDFSFEVGEPNFPEGIDYERWRDVVQPSPRSGFVDRLDFDIDFADD